MASVPAPRRRAPGRPPGADRRPAARPRAPAAGLRLRAALPRRTEPVPRRAVRRLVDVRAGGLRPASLTSELTAPPQHRAAAACGREVLRVEDLGVHFPLTEGIGHPASGRHRPGGRRRQLRARGAARRSGSSANPAAASRPPGLAILRLLEPTAGRIVFDGERHHAPRRGACADPPPHADRLPGPLRLAEPAHDGARHRRRAAARCTASRGDPAALSRARRAS